MKITTYALTLPLMIAIASCAGQPKKQPAQPAPAKEAVEEVEPTPVAAPAKSKFDALNHEQRVAFMKTEIMPRMTKAFQEFDAKHFAAFTCVTCHGPGAKEGKFEMPTATLPKLDFAAKDPKHERWNAFMGGKVVPGMASALGEQPFDPATKKGFGCLKCHTRADK